MLKTQDRNIVDIRMPCAPCLGHSLATLPYAGPYVTTNPTTRTSRVFAIYHIMLRWKTCNCYYETVELPNPGPTQPKKN